MTVRSVVSGLILATVMCAMNSYLTLSFGVIEEGPTVAALLFFAFFSLVRTGAITTTEMVVVATMGSAGGSFGFIANFFAAKAMTAKELGAEPYSIAQMISFGIATSLVGIAMVVPLRELLIRKENLPWPGAKVTASVIRSLVASTDKRQPIYLFATFAVMCFFVVFNNEGGFGWFPAEIHLPLIAAYGGALSLAPFALGGSYLMGLRTCAGFLVGAMALMIMSATGIVPMRPDETGQLVASAAPHTFYWPGIGFLTASGLALVAINWRVLADSFRSLLSFGGTDTDPEQIVSGRAFALLLAGASLAAIAVLVVGFGVPAYLVVVLIAVGGLLQNIIATRAQAQTAFNPARVMGILLEGVCWALGGRASHINLTGAGFVAGSGAQAGNLTADMAYGRKFFVPPRWQFIVQFLTIVPCSVVAAFVFHWIAAQDRELAAPVARAWSAASLIFDGRSPLPPGAAEALAIGAVIGVVYTLIESIPRFTRSLPCSVGIGIGLVLPVSYGIAFFVGGVVFWIVLGRWLKVSDVTLTTLAVGFIVAEGIGGVLKPILTMAGVL